jgi:hypothetical protein
MKLDREQTFEAVFHAMLYRPQEHEEALGKGSEAYDAYINKVYKELHP